MKIKLSPINICEQLVAYVVGDTITLNGASFDLSPLLGGETLPSDAIGKPWITGDVQRIDGEIHLTLLLPHGYNAPQETRFPAAQNEPMTVTDGPVPLPPYELNEEEPA